MTPKKTTLIFLKICFLLNVLAIINYFVVITTTLSNTLPIQDYINSPLYNFLGGLGAFLSFGAMVLWGYCIYFFYKYDKYSKDILKIMLFPGFFSMFYFYNIIWKRKRLLINTINTSEPVLGKTIHLLEEEE